MPNAREHDDLRDLQPQFKAIEDALRTARKRPKAAGASYRAALLAMEEVLERIRERQVGDANLPATPAGDDAPAATADHGLADRAAAVGDVGAAATADAANRLGGISVATGSTAFGLAGITSATLTTAGLALVGAAGLFVLYRSGHAALTSELGKTATGQARKTAKRGTDYVKQRMRRQDTA